MDYTLHKTTLEDGPKVEEFIHDNFLPHVPLTMLFGLQNNPPPRPPPRQQIKDTKDFTIKALNLDGQIIGIAINRVQITYNTDSETSPAAKKMVELLKFAEEKAELNKLPEKTIELRVLSVRQDWRQRGVARKLVEESMGLARAEGFTTMKMCCISEFTAKLARSLGWREHYRLAYRDYPRLSGTEVELFPYPPHDYLYYYVTDL